MAELKVYYKRDLEDKIAYYLDVKEIIALVGVRQCGKTTLLKKIAGGLEKNNRKVNFISFDDLTILHLFEEDIQSFIQLHIEPYEFLFIDEIQYSRESGRKLKYIYDHCKIKIVVSGTSAPDISVQSLKYLVGRILIFKLFPFSFREFLRVKNAALVPVYDNGAYKEAILSKLLLYLNEYIRYGGFPRVVTSGTNNEKILVLKNIYSTYLLREIRDIFQLSSDFKIIKLVKLLAVQMGSLINYNELCQAAGLKMYELKHFLNIFQKTYIISLVQPFYTNKQTEIIKSPKLYFNDFGFRNISLDNFSPNMAMVGENYEQFVFSEFLKNEVELKYWRSKSKAEVDFVWDKEEVIPIEIKTTLNKPKVSRSFYSFLEKYKSPVGYILSDNYESEILYKEAQQIKFLPILKYNRVFK